VIDLCCLIVAWLSLQSGISRDTANILLRLFKFIILTALRLIKLALAAADIETAELTEFKMPLDIWTSRPCNTDLYTQHVTSSGLQRIPECLYTTQSLESWLIFLLSHSQIEDHLHQTFAKSQGAFNPGWMHDIYDSPAWSSLRPFLQSPYHLVFALYIDWFNPLTNKIAGKVVSCGAIILYCLNLPISIRFLCANMLTIGMSPSPHAPTIWTIPHVLEPIKNMIL
ncbi:hypothetical protein L208DRAFT_1109830, partial [Tricholoma matsutake]